MTVQELVHELADRGAVLSVISGGTLRCRPASVLTPELSAAITELKPALLRLFANTPVCAECGEQAARPYSHFCADCAAKHAPDDPATYPCPTCGRPARRLGKYVSPDGLGRYHCRTSICCLALWRPVATAKTVQETALCFDIPMEVKV